MPEAHMPSAVFNPALVLVEDQRAEQILAAFLSEAFRPSERLPVDAWAEKYLDLSSRVTRLSGRLELDRTPYLRGPLRAFTAPLYRRHIYGFGAQIGKTIILQIIMAYIIDNDPGPMMVVYPDRTTAKRRSRKHLRPLIEDAPVLKRHTTGKTDDLQTFEYKLDRMTVNLAWAGSPSMLASEPIRYLVRDEFAKFRHLDKSEAHPVELSARRVISYSHLAKIIDATTPGLAGKVGDADIKNGTYHECWVPCPHCGKPDLLEDVPDPVMDPRMHVEGGDVMSSAEAMTALLAKLKRAGYQVIEWDNITWDKKAKDLDQMADSAHYICPLCRGRIDYAQVHSMVMQCRWIPRHPDRVEASWHLPSWYRDTEETSFSGVVARWLKAQGDPGKIQDCLNSDRAVGYEDLGSGRKEEDIRRICVRSYARNTVPFAPLYVFLTVDLRAPEIHFVVRAWTYYETSGQVRYDVLARMSTFRQGDVPTGETLAEVDRIREMVFRGPDGHEYPINLTGIDSGFNTDEVYEYCRKRSKCVAMKGEDGMRQIMAYTRPQKEPTTNEPRYDSCHLIAWQKEYFADVLDGRMGIGEGMPGEWMLPADIGDDLLAHLTAEKKLEKISRWGRSDKRWRQTRKGNHWLDCERMQMVLARFVGLADAKPTQAPIPTTESQSASGFLGRDASGYMDRFQR